MGAGAVVVAVRFECGCGWTDGVRVCVQRVESREKDASTHQMSGRCHWAEGDAPQTMLRSYDQTRLPL